MKQHWDASRRGRHEKRLHRSFLSTPGNSDDTSLPRPSETALESAPTYGAPRIDTEIPPLVATAP